MPSTPQYQVILTTCTDIASAQSLAQGLLEQRLAACINVLLSVQSWYEWQGEWHYDAEVLLFIKSTAVRYAEIEHYIQEHHPYDVPELLCLPIEQGLPAYWQWLADTVS